MTAFRPPQLLPCRGRDIAMVVRPKAFHRRGPAGGKGPVFGGKTAFVKGPGRIGEVGRRLAEDRVEAGVDGPKRGSVVQTRIFAVAQKCSTSQN